MLNLTQKILAISAFILLPHSISHAAEIKAVASFSILADLAKNVGGDKVEIITLVGPDGDAHTYEPRPADAQNIKNADIVLINGLNLEGFMTRLIDASGTKAHVITLTKGITPIKAEDEHQHSHENSNHHDDHDKSHKHDGEHNHGGIDPHAWQSVSNTEIYVKNIADGFCSIDAQDCETYKSNANAYIIKLKALNAKIKTQIAALPADKKTIITSHDAFGYFAHEYGLTFLAPEGVSTQSEATASDVAALVKQIKHDKASALFVENISNPRLIEQISKETGLKIGGELYSDALSSPSGPASTYLEMMEHNLATITKAID